MERSRNSIIERRALSIIVQRFVAVLFRSRSRSGVTSLIEAVTGIQPIPPIERKPIEVPILRVYEDRIQEVVYVYNSKGVLESTRVQSLNLEA